jgi:hypothetical protein
MREQRCLWGSLLVALVLCASLFAARDDCRKRHPRPIIKFDHQDSEGRVYIPVVNFSAYENEMFREAPELPPCGANTKSARTWVDIYNADTNARIYGFCALSSNEGLKDIWFKSEAKGGRVYIVLSDRACRRKYRSNTLAWGIQDNCRKPHPNPIIKFERKDAEDRVYIPVLNWAAYENEMFRQAPELPPCGTNTKAARTWVDIYNADTNARIYGFCALDSNAGLKDIWFKAPAPKGRAYIVLLDRACKKRYRSNTIRWQ